ELLHVWSGVSGTTHYSRDRAGPLWRESPSRARALARLQHEGVQEGRERGGQGGDDDAGPQGRREEGLASEARPRVPVDRARTQVGLAYTAQPRCATGPTAGIICLPARSASSRFPPGCPTARACSTTGTPCSLRWRCARTTSLSTSRIRRSTSAMLASAASCTPVCTIRPR